MTAFSNETPKGSRQYAKKYLEDHGVQLIFREKVVDHKSGIFITNNKRRIKADLGIWCAGITLNPWYHEKLSIQSVFTEQNALKVNQLFTAGGLLEHLRRW